MPPPTGKPDFSARENLSLEEETEQVRISIVCDRLFTSGILLRQPTT